MRGGRLFPVRHDWYEWRQEPPLPVPVFVRIGARHDGRLVLRGLRIDGEPTADLLRGIPVGRIEAAANAQLTHVVPAVPGQVARRQSWPDVRPPEPVPLPGWDEGVRVSRQRGRGDEFYRELAAAYLELAQLSPRPVTDLARTHEVPQTTAHRWVKEARRRGFLPPGRSGKAG